MNKKKKNAWNATTGTFYDSHKLEKINILISCSTPIVRLFFLFFIFVFLSLIKIF